VTNNQTITAQYIPIGTPPTNAQTPTITGQPNNLPSITVGSTNAISVTANVTDGGTMSYQWYSNTSASNTGGTAINGATSSSFTVPTGTAGTFYYYVIVTNNNPAATVTQTATAPSNVATVTVNAAGTHDVVTLVANTPDSGTGWSWGGTTLTFSGTQTIPHGFILQGGGNIALNGTTTINSSIYSAITSTGDLSIGGTGSLEINQGATNNEASIAVTDDNNLTINSGNITINTASSWGSIGVEGTGDFILNGGRVDIIIANWGAVWANTVHINNGELIITALISADSFWLGNFNMSGGDLTINGGRFGINATNVEITGGNANIAVDTGDGIIATTVIIGGDAVINATGGFDGTDGGAGISVSSNGSGSGRTITIEGNANVTAQGGPGGAGIGGGWSVTNASGETIIIRGNATVIATGGTGAAGIGGASGGAGGDITISGGTVTATAGGGTGNQSAIGRGNGGADGTVTITGNWNYSTNTTNSATGAEHDTGAFNWNNTYRYIRLEAAAGGAAATVSPAVGGVTNFATLADAITAINANPGDYTITISADQTLSPQFIGENITLVGDNTMRTITLNGNGSLFQIFYATLTLGNNITLQGHGANNNPLLFIDSGGGLIMNDGSIITGNTNTSQSIPGGGGVVVDSGTFTMNGGIISNNHTHENSGGGVRVSGGVFTMNGGTISYNSALYGGGVDVYGPGRFIMESGTISNNTATQSGGGGINAWSEFTGVVLTINGGTISNNTSLLGEGGGVSMGRGTFNMRGGTISGNSAPNGGGVVFWNGGGLQISNGTIYGTNGGANANTATSTGAAVHVIDGGVMYGTFVGNTFTPNDTIFTSTEFTIEVIDGALSPP
jgi:hypothetical protein